MYLGRGRSILEGQVTPRDAARAARLTQIVVAMRVNAVSPIGNTDERVVDPCRHLGPTDHTLELADVDHRRLLLPRLRRTLGTPAGFVSPLPFLVVPRTRRSLLIVLPLP